MAAPKASVPKKIATALAGAVGTNIAGQGVAGLQSFVDSLGSFIPGMKEASEVVKTFNNQGDGLYNRMIENSKVLEDYRIRLTNATGAGSGFVEMLRKQTYELNEYGVGLANVVQANEEMAKSYGRATFSAAQTRQGFESERVELQKLLTTNEKFGLSMGETVSFANKMSNSVANNVQDVTKLSDTMLMFARGSGQSFSKVMQEFNTYSERFIATLDSDKAMRSFTTLETMARRAGGSVQNLVNSISQFDDIDTSFAAGGKINQILSQFGGSFDTLAAANASEEEVAEMLISSLKDIAGNFNQQMTDPKQRRAVLKDLQKEFKLPPEMIAGILNEQNSLSKDMLSIARTRSVTKVEAMPEEDKRAMALDLTKQRDVQRIQQENLFIGNMTFALEKFVANQKQEIISGSRAIGESIDKVMKEARTGNFAESFNLAGEAVKAYTSTIKTFTDDFVSSLGSQGIRGVLDQAGEKLKQNVDAIDSDRALKAAEQRINALHAANKTQEEAKINAYKSQIVEALKTQQPQIDLRGINVQVNFPGGGFKVYDRAGNLIAQG